MADKVETTKVEAVETRTTTDTTPPKVPAQTEATEMTAEEKAEHEAKMGKTPDQLERDAWQGADYDPRNPRGAPGQHVEQGMYNEGKAPQTRDTEWAQALDAHYKTGAPLPTTALCYCGKNAVCMTCELCEQHCQCSGTARRHVEGSFERGASAFSTADLPSGQTVSRRGAANPESGKETAEGDVVDDAQGASGDVDPTKSTQTPPKK